MIYRQLKDYQVIASVHYGSCLEVANTGRFSIRTV